MMGRREKVLPSSGDTVRGERVGVVQERVICEYIIRMGIDLFNT